MANSGRLDNTLVGLGGGGGELPLGGLTLRALKSSDLEPLKVGHGSAARVPNGEGDGAGRGGELRTRFLSLKLPRDTPSHRTTKLNKTTPTENLNHGELTVPCVSRP